MIEFNISEAAADKLMDQLNVLNGEKLRISIQGGGCAGMEYLFEVEKNIEDMDFVFKASTGAEVIIDNISAEYLNGATLDFIDELFNSRFVLKNPNANTTCGCGQSFAG